MNRNPNMGGKPNINNPNMMGQQNMQQNMQNRPKMMNKN